LLAYSWHAYFAPVAVTMFAATGTAASAAGPVSVPTSVPAAGVWQVDSRLSCVVFAGRHVLGAITGQLPDVSGTLVIADDAPCAVDIVIGVAAADFRSELWNEVVRGQDLLGAREYPVARYVSRRVRSSGATTLVDGTLELHGHRGDVSLSVIQQSAGTGTARFTATAVLDRRAFGLRWGHGVVGGDRLIAREVRLEIALAVDRIA
jgi:polyisoprenoid-binding protein YceI